MNFEGESCPNGALKDSCLCSVQASNDKWKSDRAKIEAALKHTEPSRLYLYVLVLSCVGVLVAGIIDPSFLKIRNFVYCALLSYLVKMWRDDAEADTVREELKRQELLEMRCGIHLLLSERVPPKKAIGEDPYPYTTAATKAALEKARAVEINEHNREAKRRLKLRKAAAIERHRHEQNLVTAQAVKESLEYEQRLRNQVAAERNWPYHPNDMDWLDDEQRKDMLKAFSERGPFKDEWLKPDGLD